MQDLVRDVSSRFFHRRRDSFGEKRARGLKRMTSATDKPHRKYALQQRLEELVILEIQREGERRYFNFTVRQLYNLVLKSITKPSSICYSDSSFPFIPLGERRHSVAGDVVNEKSSTIREHERLSMARIESLRVSDVKAKKKDHITYRERLGGHLHPRDMRRLVIPFSSTNEPELIVRRHVMLMNFDPLRAIVLRDRMFVLVPDGADSILETLEARVQGLIEVECSVFGDQDAPPTSQDIAESERTPLMSKNTLNSGAPHGLYSDNIQATDLNVAAPSSESEEEGDGDEFGHLDSDEIDEIESRTWIDLPFELQCVDAVLHSAIDLLSSQAEEVLESTQLAMEQLLKPETGVGSFAQEMLRTSKNNVHEMASQVQGFVRALTQVLNEDEDMALMNLSRLITHPDRFIQPVSRAVLEEESDEPELLLEAYLQQAVTLSNMVRSMQRRVQTTEELVNMKSDNVRNKILYVNMLLSLSSLAVGIVSAVGGIFGMNLQLPDALGESPNAFGPVVLISSGGAFLLILIVLFILGRSGILSAAV